MEPLSRRDLLRCSALGLTFAAGRGWATRDPSRSLLTIWLEGGPSQLETWDPHPKLSQCELLPTRIGGASLASFYPRLAEQVHLLSLIRSISSKEGDHERATSTLKTGHRPEAGVEYPSLGSLATMRLPPSGLQIPAHVSLVKSQWPARSGMLGSRYDAFKVADPGGALENLEARATSSREERRLSVEQLVDSRFAGQHAAAVKAGHDTRDAALKMMSTEQLDAFRLSDEPSKVLSSYGGSAFGRGCLVARRLLERGVRAVEVTLGGFDSHARNQEAHRSAAGTLDGALASLLSELQQRDLLQRTVVWVVGEFGRTPKVNKADGRDHWPHAFSCLLGGGGIRGGQVLGATDPEGVKQEPADPVSVEDLTATVLAGVGVDPGEELIAPSGRPVTNGNPLKRMLL
jgi:uncharacterized protein (DUF1501 family)